MNEILAKLKEGVRRFQSDIYAERSESYRTAASQPQRPHTLVITCADSRIDPEALMQAGIGEVFVTRNVGNMVPAYGEMMGGVSAVIEYAVSALGVQHVVVCGHSDCGAMKALLHPESTTSMPAVTSWLSNGRAALTRSTSMGNAEDQAGDKLTRITEQNVLMQIHHLKTHPSVTGAIAREALTISGWIYDIGSGEVRIVEDGGETFISVSEAEQAKELRGQ